MQVFTSSSTSSLGYSDYSKFGSKESSVSNALGLLGGSSIIPGEVNLPNTSDLPASSAEPCSADLFAT